MSMLDYFSDELNRSLVVLEEDTITDEQTMAIISQGWTPKDGVVHPCCIWSKSLAEKYMGQGLWRADTKWVACLKPIADISSTNRVLVDDIMYELDYPDNVAGQDEVLLLGLRSIL